MNALERFGLAALAFLAPPETREALIGDLLEERAMRCEEGVKPSAAGAWLLRQCAHSVPPLLLLRARRAGPRRLALASAGALVAAAAMHATQQSGWRWLLSLVPLRADHEPPPVLALVFGLSQCVAALMVALLLLRLTRSGGRT